MDQRDPEKGQLGPNSIPGHSDDPEISQLDAEYDSVLSQSDPIISQDLVRRKLTKFLVIPGTEYMTPMDPIPGHADPRVFRVIIMIEIYIR